MNNAQMDRFVKNPIGLEKNRSKFDLSHDKLTTLMPGRLQPILCCEVLPGDTFTLDLASLVRMSTPLHPVMDNAFMDVHFFFVPNRLVWRRWKQFMGESLDLPWVPSTVYTVPQIRIPSGGFQKGTIADGFDIPLYQGGGSDFSALPFRAYVNIWNNFYRDENLMSVASMHDDETVRTGTNAGMTNYENYVTTQGYVSNAELGGAPLPVCRIHDMFSSALPYPQRGPAVSLNLAGFAPVVNDTDKTQLFNPIWYYDAGGHVANNPGLIHTDLDGKTAVLHAVDTDPAFDTTNLANADSINLALKANLAGVSAVTITQLRNAIMVQRYYEALARGGARYFEQIRAFFGVVVPDATVQIPEFLGGRRFPINITQVAQTSESTSQKYLGDLAAYSLTTDKDSIFTKSFTEHGYLIGVCCVRTEHSYSQGLPRHFSRLTTQDFYNPMFAFTSEQPIYNKELFLTGTAATDNGVFGYRAAWDEYRSLPNKINGEFSPNYPTSLDSYHYGDDYASTPSLSAGWIAEPSSQVARTLAVNYKDFFLCDFHFDLQAVRPLPLYSVPGLSRF